MNKSILFLVVLITFLFTSCAAPPNLEDAKKAYSNKDYSRALELFTSLAEDGNAEAQYYLGLMYEEGKGVRRDREEAVKWYRKAAEGMDVDVEEAKASYDSGDYSTALKLFKLLAEAGNAEAQNGLGVMYYWGEGVEQDYRKAFKWYSKSAEQGHVGAQYYVGYMYYEGKGVKQDRKEALKWYRKAVEQRDVDTQDVDNATFDLEKAKTAYSNENYIVALGLFRVLAKDGNVEAQYYVGYMYYKGEGVEKDYKEAMKWYRKAAEQGYVTAQYNLGLMYYEGEGEGVGWDYKEAMKWYRKAAEQGYAEAQNNLGLMYHFGVGVEEDYKEAMKWYRKAAEQGYAPAQYGLGVMYYWGKGVEKDYKEAIRWYRKSAEQGNVEAQFNLGLMYDEGKGVEQDREEALRLYRKAAEGMEVDIKTAENILNAGSSVIALGLFRLLAEEGNAEAQNALGNMYYWYYWGRGVAEDNKEAVKWYRKSAEQGNVEAQYNLGLMYDEGKGVEQDREEALRWYRKAAEGMEVDIENAKNIYNAGDHVIALGLFRLLVEEGNAEAQNGLGNMYYWGIKVDRNYKEAVKWYRKSAEQGNVEAQFNLGLMYAEGKGVAEDKKEALRLYRKAAEGMEVDIKNAQNILDAGDYVRARGVSRLLAEAGNAEAQYYLGLMYSFGVGVEEDKEEAFRWYRKSAEQGYVIAQYHLGLMYAKGEGVGQNDILAHMWLSIAEELGDKASRSEINRLEQLMSSEDISEAQSLAQQCKESNYQNCGE